MGEVTRGYEGMQETPERGLCLMMCCLLFRSTSAKDLSVFSNYLVHFIYRTLTGLRQHQSKKINKEIKKMFDSSCQ